MIRKLIDLLIRLLFGRKGQAAADAYQTEAEHEAAEAQAQAQAAQDVIVQEAQHHAEEVDTADDSQRLSAAQSLGIVQSKGAGGTGESGPKAKRTRG